MSKTTTLYLSMIVVFVAGLWAIVHVGRSLRAPHDISGNWALADKPDTDSPANALAVSQSGRFVKLKVGGGTPIDLVMESHTTVGEAQQIVFKGGDQELTVRTPPPTTSPDDAKPYQFALRGPLNATYLAKREAAAAQKPAAH